MATAFSALCRAGCRRLSASCMRASSAQAAADAGRNLDGLADLAHRVVVATKFAQQPRHLQPQCRVSRRNGHYLGQHCCCRRGLGRRQHHSRQHQPRHDGAGILRANLLETLACLNGVATQLGHFHQSETCSGARSRYLEQASQGLFRGVETACAHIGTGECFKQARVDRLDRKCPLEVVPGCRVIRLRQRVRRRQGQDVDVLRVLRHQPLDFAAHLDRALGRGEGCDQQGLPAAITRDIRQGAKQVHGLDTAGGDDVGRSEVQLDPDIVRVAQGSLFENRDGLALRTCLQFCLAEQRRQLGVEGVLLHGGRQHLHRSVVALQSQPGLGQELPRLDVFRRHRHQCRQVTFGLFVVALCQQCGAEQEACRSEVRHRSDDGLQLRDCAGVVLGDERESSRDQTRLRGISSQLTHALQCRPGHVVCTTRDLRVGQPGQRRELLRQGQGTTQVRARFLERRLGLRVTRRARENFAAQ